MEGEDRFVSRASPLGTAFSSTGTVQYYCHGYEGYPFHFFRQGVDTGYLNMVKVPRLLCFS